LTLLSTYVCILTYDYLQTGAKALAGKSEFIKLKIFEAVDYDRKITGKGKSIMCYDPKADEDSEPLWDEESVTDELVPIGHKVQVIGATVKFTRATA
jgi:hypothetical protein